MRVEVGKYTQQRGEFKALILNPFPPKGVFDVPRDILVKERKALTLIGDLRGMTRTLPDVEFFLSMFAIKDATSSAQIEGTKATLIDALKKESNVGNKDTDADDIIDYVKALNHGIKQLDTLPLSLRFIRDVHSILMRGARSTHFADPGEFRRTQNWIGGTSPSDASFVPPPVEYMHSALHDFEKSLHDTEGDMSLVYIGIMHAQFETIHPFLDGNGRTGRLLIAFLLLHRELLEKPVLFLSSYFKKHQELYYQKLNAYHNSDVDSWLHFFLDGVIEVAQESIEIANKIRVLRDTDMQKIQALGKTASKSSMVVLPRLFSNPIVTTSKVMEWTGFTHSGAQRVIDRFIELNILEPQEEKGTYGRSYMYRRYLVLFLDK